MVIVLLLCTLLLEFFLYRSVFWHHRRAIVFTLFASLPGLTAAILIQDIGIGTVFVALFSFLRLFNLLRVAMGRIHHQYLRNSARRTSQIFIGGQLLSLLSVLLLNSRLELVTVLTILAYGQLAIGLIALILTLYNLYKTRYKQGKMFYADSELPTVSLLIPARNETFDLEECLRSALASDYPKLEIIVLDDCSQIKTSEIIKSFAHKGVRFIKGEEPTTRWLAKNHAYEKLSREASGELLLFCGVDVRFGPHAIKALVTELLNRDKHMISVLPHRVSGNLAGAFIQPMRYWWELSLPRVFFNRPPVLSTCWLIRNHVLQELGGLEAVSHSILPEGFYARELVKSNMYSFIRANDTLDIQTRKSYGDQRATALRTRYPQLRRRPEVAFFLIISELIVFIGPVIAAMYGFVTHDSSLTNLGLAAIILFTLNHVIIVQFTSPANVAVALINFPVEAITGSVITLISMMKYEFGTVEWKDRNVCIPVMHVIPHLPYNESDT